MANQSFNGVGESKLHGGEVQHPHEAVRGTWTIEGKKVPSWLNVPYAVTDQGIAERRAKLEAEGRLSDVSLSVVDENDKRGGAPGNPTAEAFARSPQGGDSYREPNPALAEYRDRGLAGVPDLDNPNAMDELMRRHLPAGMRGRFLSPEVCDKRGMRGWKPLEVDDGKGGKTQVKVGNMFLGVIPEEQAKRRERKVIEDHSRQVSNTVEEARDRIERAGVDAAAMRRVAKRRGQEPDGVGVRDVGEFDDGRPSDRQHGSVDIDAADSPRLGNFEVTV